MGTYHLRGSHVALIAKTHVKYSVRGGPGLIFVLFSIMAGLMIAGFIVEQPISALETMEKTGEKVDFKEAIDAIAAQSIPLLNRFASVDEQQATYLALEKPALLSAFFVVMVFFLPYLIALGSFNQYAGDIVNRGLRYQLLRTERANIYIGRFIGTFVFTVLTLLGLMAMLVVWMLIKADFYPAGDIVLWSLQGLLAMIIYALPWIALCGWMSSVIDSAFGALAVSLAIIVFYPLVVFIGSRAKDWMEYGNYALPWGWKWWLWEPGMGTFLAGSAVMLGFTALFGFLGLRHFATRDL